MVSFDIESLIDEAKEYSNIRLSFKLYAESEVIKSVEEMLDIRLWIGDCVVGVDNASIRRNSRDYKNISYLIELFIECYFSNSSTLYYWDEFSNLVTYIEKGTLKIVSSTRPKGIEIITTKFGPIDNKVITEDLTILFNDEDRSSITEKLLDLNKMAKAAEDYENQIREENNEINEEYLRENARFLDD